MAIDIVVRANSKQAVKELKALGYQVKSVGKDTGKYTDKLLKAGAAYFSVTAANKLFRMGLSLTSEMLQTLIVDMAIWGDRMSKQARMVGMTAEQYQGLEFAAERSGTSITHVGHGLKKLGRVMVDAASGSKQLQSMFGALGIEIYKADGTLRDTFDVFLELSDKSAILGESAERTGMLMLLLGRSGTEMANMMSQGAEGVLEMQGTLEHFNATMSEEGLRASEAFVDRLADMNMAFRGIKLVLAEELIPSAAASMVVWNELLATLGRTDELESAGSAIGRYIENATVNVAVNIRSVLLQWEHFREIAIDSFRSVAFAYQAMTLQMEGHSERARKMWEMSVTHGTRAAEASLDSLSSFVTGRDGELSRGLETHFGLTEEMRRELALYRSELVGVIHSEKVRIKTGTEGSEEMLAMIERLQDSLRRSVAGIGAAKEAQKNQKDEIDATSKKIEENWKLRKEVWAWEKAQAVERKEVQQAFFDEFYKKDTGEILALFEQRKLTEEQFRAEMAEANEQALIEEWRRRLEIIEAALASEHITYQEAAARRRQIDRELAEDRQTLADETEAAIAERQREAVAAFADVLGATSRLFGALSNIMMQMYEEGDAEAKAHAERLFYIQQAFALAMAIVNTALSVSNALATGVPPVNIINAAAMGIAGAAEIATIIGTTIQGIGDAGIPPGALRQAGLNQHTGIIMRNDEMLIDPVGTRHISEMLEIQKSQMAGGVEGDRTIRTTVELDGRVLGESVDNYLIRQQERGIPYTDRVRGSYL